LSDTLTARLAARGYAVLEESVNTRGRVQLVISGPGLDQFKMYQTDAEALADGRLTPEELQEQRERLARMRS
jgi:hypothetical protein